MDTIQQLANALIACGINATVSTTTALDLNNKRRLCTFVSTDFWTGEDSLEFVFHPTTGKLVDSICDCPIVEKK